MATHPSDAPLFPMRGVGRIVSANDIRQPLVDLVGSKYCYRNALCQASVALITETLLPLFGALLAKKEEPPFLRTLPRRQRCARPLCSIKRRRTLSRLVGQGECTLDEAIGIARHILMYCPAQARWNTPSQYFRLNIAN